MNEHSNISATSKQPTPAALNTDAVSEVNEALPQAIAIQCSLSVGAPDDPLEHEADKMADTVMRMPLTLGSIGKGPEAIQRKCAACEEEEKAQRKPLSASITPFIQTKSNGEATTSAFLSNKINSSRGNGTSMDDGTKTFMESRFGSDFSSVNIHTGSESVMMNRELNAKAFTVGNDIYFNEGQYNPQSDSGKHLLAHELTHTIQQGKGVQRKIQRFEASERSQISSLANIIAQARTFASNASTIGGFVEQAGGSTASAVVRGVFNSGPSNNTALTRRYLVTCRCGMIDMRHFYQIMYIASTFTNRKGTEAGRSHELEAEATSRFAAEDTTSNALGSFFGANNFNLFYTSVDTFIDRLERFLNRCSPVDFSTLPAAEQTAIVNFYSQRNAAGVPVNQNESAVPTLLNISSCGTNRSFPFALDTGDPNRKTINSEAFSSGVASLTSDSSIRDFVFTQRSEIIRALTQAEKVTLITRLLSGWISDADVSAAIEICRQANAVTGQLHNIHRLIEPLLESMTSETQRNSVHRALSGNF